VTSRTKPDVPLDGMAPRMQVCLRYTAEGSELRNDMKISAPFKFQLTVSTKPLAVVGW